MSKLSAVTKINFILQISRKWDVWLKSTFRFSIFSKYSCVLTDFCYFRRKDWIKDINKKMLACNHIQSNDVLKTICSKMKAWECHKKSCKNEATMFKIWKKRIFSFSICVQFRLNWSGSFVPARVWQEQKQTDAQINRQKDIQTDAQIGTISRFNIFNPEITEYKQKQKQLCIQ